MALVHIWVQPEETQHRTCSLVFLSLKQQFPHFTQFENSRSQKCCAAVLFLGTNSEHSHGAGHVSVQETPHCLEHSNLPFQNGGRRSDSLPCKCQQQLLVYLQNHQAVCEFSQFVFHCTVTSEISPAPAVCQAQLFGLPHAPQVMAAPRTRRCRVQGSSTESQAQPRLSSSSATWITSSHGSRSKGTC